MTEPENQTLYLLRELREGLRALDEKVDRHRAETTSQHAETTKRLDGLRQAINGESVLGRYAAAEVEERLSAIEHRLDALEQGR